MTVTTDGLYSLQPFLMFALVLFCMGLYAVLSRRNLIAILIGVELMLNAASINFLAFNNFGVPDVATDAVTGQVVVLFIIGLAAAEVAIALAVVLVVYRARDSIDVEELRDLHG